jgi:uncharacterized membrane protein YozB (DUF420 family)
MNSQTGVRDDAPESARARVAILALSTVVVVAVAGVVRLLPKGAGAGTVSALPFVNASLNAIAGALLIAGYVFIRKRNVRAHRACMLAAFSASSAFLITYLIHHARVGSVPFRGLGFARVVYFLFLVPHIVLAAAIVPLALLTLYRGYTDRIAAHRRIARYTLPIWLYVSVSGVVIYVMLYHMQW